MSDPETVKKNRRFHDGHVAHLIRSKSGEFENRIAVGIAEEAVR